MAESTRRGIKVTTNGTMPMEKAFSDAMKDPRIAVLLIGLRTPTGSSNGKGVKRKADTNATSHQSEEDWFNSRNEGKLDQYGRDQARIRQLEIS